jgi:cytoskeleton protein RodZ
MPEAEFHTDLTVGEILRRCRVKYNITYEQAEQDIRIKAEHLEALEHNSIERLPGRVYVFGFVRTYSEYLGLDGEKMVQLLKKQAGRKIEKPRPKISVSLEDEEEQKNPGFPVIAASALAFIALLVFIGTVATPDTAREIPPVSKQLSNQLTVLHKPAEGEAPVAADGGGQAAEESISEAAVEAPHPVILKALQGTWLEIRDINRAVVFSRVLNPGEEYWVPDDRGDLTMTLGNAGGLEILVEGKPIPVLGGVGQVKRNVSLNVQALSKSLPNKAHLKSQ